MLLMLIYQEQFEIEYLVMVALCQGVGKFIKTHLFYKSYVIMFHVIFIIR